MQIDDTYQAALSHVLWIGGGTDAGKSSIAERLVANMAYNSMRLMTMPTISGKIISARFHRPMAIT
jgi:adenylylsulfate kinase-like enzyme